MTTVKSLISSLSIVREQKGSKSPGSSLRSIRTTFTIAINALCLQLFPPEQNGNINRILYIYRTGNNEQEQNNYSKPPEIALKRVNCTIGGIFQRLSLTSPVHHITLRSLLIDKSLKLATWLTKPCFEYFMKLHLFTNPLVGGRSTGVL